MGIIKMDQGTPEWLEWRMSKITATDASVIIDSSPFKNAIELWEEKLGLREPQKINDAMLRGQILEPEARKVACEIMGYEFLPCVYESDIYSWAAASLDGYDNQHNLILEIKCPKEETHLQALDLNIPLYYQDQMQWQLFVSDCKKGYYFSYRPEHKEKPFAIVEVNPHLERQEYLLSKCQEFYIHLCTMQPPIPWVFTA